MYNDANTNSSVTGVVPLYNRNGTTANTTYTAQYISTAPVCVDYRVSTSQNMSEAVASGQAYTSSDVDYTLKVCRSKKPKGVSLIVHRSNLQGCSLTPSITTSSPSATLPTLARLAVQRLRQVQTTSSTRQWLWLSTRVRTTHLASSTPLAIPPVRTRSIMSFTWVTSSTNMLRVRMAMAGRSDVSQCQTRRQGACMTTVRDMLRTAPISIPSNPLQTLRGSLFGMTMKLAITLTEMEWQTRTTPKLHSSNMTLNLVENTFRSIRER